MMSDTAPPPITLHELFDDLISFLDDSLTEQSFKVVKATRLALLELACSQYDVDLSLHSTGTPRISQLFSGSRASTTSR